MENVDQPVPDQARPLRCVVVGGSLVGLSAAIALSRLGAEVTVAERSPARVTDGGAARGDPARDGERTSDGGLPGPRGTRVKLEMSTLSQTIRMKRESLI